MMWIDTHTHLDAPEFDGDRDLAVGRARSAGVSMMIVLPGAVEHFSSVRDCAHRYGFAYTLGIHPMWTPQAKPEDVISTRNAIEQAMSDPRFVGVGEVGLDFFVPELTTADARKKQEHIYAEQLRIASEFDLPVLLHVRRSQDVLLKHLRRIAVPGGLAHAFNGSHQQAEEFTKLGFKLGFGGTVTFERALQIRRLAADMPLSSIVMETDSPDIAPHWAYKQRNEPAYLPRIAQVVAGLRGISPDALADATWRNACAALPRLATLLNNSGAI
jgi:TatD DNase family protein